VLGAQPCGRTGAPSSHVESPISSRRPTEALKHLPMRLDLGDLVAFLPPGQGPALMREAFQATFA